MVRWLQGLLSDLDGFARFKSQCEALLARIKTESDGRYEAWLAEVEQRIDDDDGSLKLQVEFDGPVRLDACLPCCWGRLLCCVDIASVVTARYCC